MSSTKAIFEPPALVALTVASTLDPTGFCLAGMLLVNSIRAAQAVAPTLAPMFKHSRQSAAPNS